MGRYADMTLKEYDADIRMRLDKRAQQIINEFTQQHTIGGSLTKAQQALMRDPDYAERRLSDEWTRNGRNDFIFLHQYKESLRSLVSYDISKTRYWKFTSSWLNDAQRFKGRPVLDQVLWITFLVPSYNLPFVVSPVFGAMITIGELQQLRFYMRMPPFSIEPQTNKSETKGPSPEDIRRAMTTFDSMKQEPERSRIIKHTYEDMVRFAEWLASPLSSDVAGQKAVERALEPIRHIGSSARPATKSEPKICPVGHRNPPSAKFCGFCDEPYRFPTLPSCGRCKTVAMSEAQKRCHECGEPLYGESPTPDTRREQPYVQDSEDNGQVYDGDDPFTDARSAVLASAPAVPKSLRQRWGRNLCDVETNEVLISTVAVQLGYPNGAVEQNLYLPESRAAYEYLMSHFKNVVSHSKG